MKVKSPTSRKEREKWGTRVREGVARPAVKICNRPATRMRALVDRQVGLEVVVYSVAGVGREDRHGRGSR